MTEKPKQVIVIRTDLAMPSGKAIAQACHASLGCLLKYGERWEYEANELSGIDFRYKKDSELGRWLSEKFTKVVLGVESLEELQKIYTKACAEGLISVLITDAGDTVFKEPTVTCLGIGPHLSSKIDKITGHLKLYRV